jgi:ubiquinone/menaquinone biosynthesis C-methylase UbiE
MVQDLFSNQSDGYSKYRPDYPQDLFDYILQFVNERDRAWDCATGNGQAAKMLAAFFKKVDASDTSSAQLEKAVQKPNIQYHLAPAEHTPFADDSFDLITIAQAYHWFNWKEFYEEATRVGKQNAVVAAWTYNLLNCEDEKVNEIIRHFYRDITGPYWDAARKYVEEGYKTVDFQFEPLPSKDFYIEVHWTREEFKGYLSTWSGVQTNIKKNGASPVPLIEADLEGLWNEAEQKHFNFPIALRIGRIVKKKPV